MTHEECTPEAWEFLKTVYLRCNAPTFAQCYRELKQVAAARGWTIPSERTLRRRVGALPAAVLLLSRGGDRYLDQRPSRALSNKPVAGGVTMRPRTEADEQYSRLLSAWKAAARDTRRRFRAELVHPSSRKAGA